MPSFEYDVQTFADRAEKSMTAYLEKAGNDGWELVYVAPIAPNQSRLFLKRERQERARVAA